MTTFIKNIIYRPLSVLVNMHLSVSSSLCVTENKDRQFDFVITHYDNYGAITDDKVVKFTTFCFQCISLSLSLSTSHGTWIIIAVRLSKYLHSAENSYRFLASVSDKVRFRVHFQP